MGGPGPGGARPGDPRVLPLAARRSRAARLRRARLAGARAHARARRPARRRRGRRRSSTRSPRCRRCRTTRPTRTCTPTSSAASTERLGPLGRKVHAGRSRNDQVAVATRLWAKDAARELALARGGGAGGAGRLRARQRGRRAAGLHAPAARPAGAARPPPGRARVDARARRRAAARGLLPRPTSARSARARWPARACRSTRSGRPAQLGFARSFDNTIDAVADRDFICDLLYACALGFVHLSRLAEEVVIFTSQEFAFAQLDDTSRARLLDHAAEEEPAGRRAPARPRGRRDRPAGGHARRLQGPAAGLRQRPAGGQGARVRAGRGLRGRARARRRCSSPACTSTPSACARRRPTARPSPPTSPRRSCAAACRSARRTSRSRRASRPASASPSRRRRRPSRRATRPAAPRPARVDEQLAALTWRVAATRAWAAA